MVELIVSVCLQTDASHCKDVRLNFTEQNISTQECLFQGQIEIAKWSESHPGWHIEKWQCGRAGVMAKA